MQQIRSVPFDFRMHRVLGILRLDGSFKRLTAAEFKATRKAGTKPWLSAPGS